MTKENQSTVILIVVGILIVLGFVARLLPHPPNFTPILAIALFSGMYLPKRWVLSVPLVAMFMSDLFIGLYSLNIMLAVYFSFAFTGYIGLWVKKRKKFSRVLGGTLFGSSLFFLITNAAVWKFTALYTHDLDGLIQSYAMALPFFKNSLLGNLFYVGILVCCVESVAYLNNFREKIHISS